MSMLDARVTEALRELVDTYRAQCLWFLRADYYPQTADEAEQVFRLIEQHGDLAALRRVAAARQWLSPGTSAASVGS